MTMLTAILLWTSITARGVINPIVVAAPEGANSALYFTLRNSSQNEDRLLRVTCDCAQRIEIRTRDTRDLGVDDGGRHTDVAPFLVMPPQRLVELRPGASRYLLLVRLRRPLVAGETVDMTFHYARGSDTRHVRIVADPQAGWAAALAEEEGPRRLAALEGLAGWCWRGSLPGGRRTDTRCFSPAYGTFMQDHYAVEGGAAPLRGYTSYFHDIMGMTTTFRDYGQEGARRVGRVVPANNGLIFEDYPPQATGRWEIHARTHWRRDGPDAWLVVAEARRSAEWRELWRLRMVRVGPAPAAD
jgi:copper(I)-binding protein